MAKKKGKHATFTEDTKSDDGPTSGTRPRSAAVFTAPDGSVVAPQAKKQSILFDNNAHKAAQMITLAALYSPVAQLSLSPVYGTAQAGLYHRYGSLVVALAAFLTSSFAPRLSQKRVTNFIPAWAFLIPTIQLLLFKYSSVLPTPFGPLITDLSTYYPLLFMSVMAAGQYFSHVDLSGFNQNLAEQLPAAGAYMLFTAVQRAFNAAIPGNMGSNLLFTRLGLQTVVAGMYALALPSAILWPALPLFGVTMVANVHNPMARTTVVLEKTLAAYNYTLLERRESLTGYISVLENQEKHFRVMRCDHSLLGGEWIVAPSKGQKKAIVGEPIYAIFAMLEAIRLVETDTAKIPDYEKTALNIGLGIGTAPSAMIMHGINTTIIELDPVVHDFATRYFGLPSNHTKAIGDAVGIVATTASMDTHATYDYIIHDVFTGGAEPVQVFTEEFFSGLNALLKPAGAVVINYAGDLNLPAASHVVRTILSTFPSCRIFREEEAASGSSSSSSKPTRLPDFTNMVIFCKKTATPVTFRKAVEADFLGSGARRAFLPPKHEIPVESFRGQGEILRRGHTKQLEAWHRESAIGHWKVMRTVLPDAVWENW